MNDWLLQVNKNGKHTGKLACQNIKLTDYGLMVSNTKDNIVYNGIDGKR